MIESLLWPPDTFVFSYFLTCFCDKLSLVMDVHEMQHVVLF